jgi:hypothetical protein
MQADAETQFSLTALWLFVTNHPSFLLNGSTENKRVKNLDGPNVAKATGDQAVLEFIRGR